MIQSSEKENEKTGLTGKIGKKKLTNKKSSPISKLDAVLNRH